MTQPVFGGAGAGWITDPADPRLAVLWPGSVDYLLEDLSFPLYVAQTQCEAFAPAIVETGWAVQTVTTFAAGFEGVLVASYQGPTVTWTVEVTNQTGGDLSAFNPVVAAGQILPVYRPTAATFLEVPGGTGATFRMNTDGALDLSWAGAWPDGVTLSFAVTGPAGATLPEPAVWGVVPEHYVAGQILQTRNLVRAGVTGDNGNSGGFEQTVTVFPMDWTVKQLLRPKRGKPYFGTSAPVVTP